MIRINLLSAERGRVKKKFIFPVGQTLMLGCAVILLATALLIGWRFLALGRQSNQLDADISAARRETDRLKSVIEQVQVFEQQRGQLQQRVVLIEQLRQAQTGPVHMLDQISRSMPPMLWLTAMKQTANDVLIEGNCTTLTGLSDFVANLEASGYFKRSVEIVNTTTETLPQPPGELIKFSIKGQFQQPTDAKPPVSAGAKVGG
jgi:type IV pilus assembly protein PilN